MALYKATIEVLIEAEDESEADGVLFDELQPLVNNPQSGWKDWHYCQMHNGEYQRFPGCKGISKEEAVEQFDEYEG